VRRVISEVMEAQRERVAATLDAVLDGIKGAQRFKIGGSGAPGVMQCRSD
jgi:hypothetical protein